MFVCRVCTYSLRIPPHQWKLIRIEEFSFILSFGDELVLPVQLRHHPLVDWRHDHSECH